jgi:hypothetical protein
MCICGLGRHMCSQQVCMLARCEALSLLKRIRSSRVICKCDTWTFWRARWVLSVPPRIGLSWGSVDTSHCSFTGWFRSVVKLYISMLKSNSEVLSRVPKADLSIHSRVPSCWTAVLDAFQRSRRRDSFVQAVRQGTSISIQKLIWGTDSGQCGEMLRDKTHRTQTASWQHITLFAVPFNLNVRAVRLPGYLH